MAEFYDPNLFLSTPENPNTMGAVFKFKEEVDGEIMTEVV